MSRADRSLVRRANSEVSVFDVLEEHFQIRVPREGSYKTYCPFAFEHADGGVEKQFRTYASTNSCYCFELHGWMGPVKLLQLKEDLEPVAAATKLLDAKGLLKPKDPHERWAEVMAERSREDIGSPNYLVEALNSYLGTHPAYSEGSISDGFLTVMEEQLRILDIILNDPRSSSVVVRSWYSRAKRELLAALDAYNLEVMSR